MSACLSIPRQSKIILPLEIPATLLSFSHSVISPHLSNTSPWLSRSLRSQPDTAVSSQTWYRAQESLGILAMVVLDLYWILTAMEIILEFSPCPPSPCSSLKFTPHTWTSGSDMAAHPAAQTTPVLHLGNGIPFL